MQPRSTSGALARATGQARSDRHRIGRPEPRHQGRPITRSDHRVRELSAHLDQPQSLVSYHLRLLRDTGLVTATRSSSDGRDSYYHLDLDHCAQAQADSGSALHPALRRDLTRPAAPLGRQLAGPVAVLFVCTGNSSRSPIAEALLGHHTAEEVT